MDIAFYLSLAAFMSVNLISHDRTVHSKPWSSDLGKLGEKTTKSEVVGLLSQSVHLLDIAGSIFIIHCISYLKKENRASCGLIVLKCTPPEHCKLLPVERFSTRESKGVTKKTAVLLDFVQMRGGRALPNFCHFFISAFLVNKRGLFPPKCR